MTNVRQIKDDEGGRRREVTPGRAILSVGVAVAGWIVFALGLGLSWRVFVWAAGL